MSNNISLNFMVSDSSSKNSNIVAEVHLEENSIILAKKHMISRKIISKDKIHFNDISKVTLSKSQFNSLESSIIIYYNFNNSDYNSNSNNSQKTIYLKSADGFAVKWFYDNLISYIESFNENDNDNDNNNDNKDNMNNNDKINKKLEDFNNFLEKVNQPLSKDKKDSLKSKNKFYNYCVNEER